MMHELLTKIQQPSPFPALNQRPNKKASPSWWLFTAVLVVIFVMLIKSQERNYFDDAYMFVRYADNLIAGYGHAWNRGEISIYGSTSLAYSLVVALLRLLIPLDATAIVVFASACFALLSVAVQAYICSHVLKMASFAKSFCLLLLACCLGSPFLYHANTGMDTTMALFSNSLLLYFLLHFLTLDASVKKLQALLLLSASCYFSFAVRPDNLLAALLCPSIAILFFSTKPIRDNCIFVAALAALLAIDAALKVWLLHDALPLAFYAKGNGFYQGYVGAHMWNPITYLIIFMASVLPYWALSRHAVTKMNSSLWLVFIFPALLTFAYYFSVVQIMGHMARYYMVFLPYFMLYFLTRIALAQKKQSFSLADYRRSIIRYIIAATALLLAAMGLPDIYQEKLNAGKTKTYTAQSSYKVAATEPLDRIDRWGAIVAIADFAKKLPAGTKFAMSEYGYIGAQAPETHIIDFMGLHDRYIAHRGFSIDYILQQEPDVIWLSHPDYTKINAQLLDSQSFQRDYEFYPKLFLYGFAIRKDSPHSAHIAEQFLLLCEKIYPQINLQQRLAVWSF